eukprot:1021396-Ditylum_brightwellii.AAC.1
MSFGQSEYLPSGRPTNSLLVSKSQPKVILSSSNLPSAISLLNSKKSGLVAVCMLRGTQDDSLNQLVSSYSPTTIVSSMNPSTFPSGSAGPIISASFAQAK